MVRTRVGFCLGLFLGAVLLIIILFNTSYQSNIDQLIDYAHHVAHGKDNVTKKSTTNTDRDLQNHPEEHPLLVYVRKFGRVKNIPNPEEMKSMSEKELHYIYHSYLDNTEHQCRRRIKMGNARDGGYPVCDDYEYRPIKPCLVYSFGIRNDFSFDDDVATMYGCHVHSFDPSMGKPTGQRSEKTWFYKLGIGNTEGKGANAMMNTNRWELKSLTQIKAMLKHQDAILDLLKIDIEYLEWPALEAILAEGELSKVRQLLIEFHSDLAHPETLWRNLPILHKLEAQGFLRFYSNLFYHGPTVNNKTIFLVQRLRCYEMSFVNPKLARN